MTTGSLEPTTPSSIPSPSAPSPKRADDITVVALAAMPKPSEAPAFPLIAETHPQLSLAQMKSLIEIDPIVAKLPPDEKDRVIQACFEAYQRALAAFEHVVAEVAWSWPEANQFADEVCRRLVEIVNAYAEIEAEMRGETPRELLRLMTLSQFFSRASLDTGAVGYNPLSIQKAMREGNLREKLTLANVAVYGLFLQKIAADPEMVRRVNQKLAASSTAGFQIDEVFLKSIVDTKMPAYVQSPIVTDHRIKESGRVKLRPAAPTPPSQEAEGPKISEFKEPSIREVRAGLEDYVSEEEYHAMKPGLASRKVGGLGGALVYGVLPGSSFAQRAVALGGLPVVTGPSGTADSFFKVAKAMGLGPMIHQGMLTMAAWMIPFRDHSLHEIRIVLPQFGIPYSGKPEDFAQLYDEHFTQAVQERMPEGHMPPYFLGSEYQRHVMNQLKPKSSPK